MPDKFPTTCDAFTASNACTRKTFNFLEGHVKKHKKQDDGGEKNVRGNRRVFPEKHCRNDSRNFQCRDRVEARA